MLSLVERGGRLRSVFLDHTTVRDALWQHLDRDSRLYTDGSASYRRFVREHSSVDHSIPSLSAFRRRLGGFIPNLASC